MMRKKVFLFLLFLAALNYSGCNNDDNPVVQDVTAKGIYILYQGIASDPNSFDYGYLDFSTGNVSPNLFKSANGNSLNRAPSGMILNQDLYITALGITGQQGNIYRINGSTNQLISSRTYGKNPYSLSIYNNKIFTSNLYGNYVSVMNMDLSSISDSVAVGPNPSELIRALDNIYVAKASFTTENSVAIINTITMAVNKIFFPAPPVSIANNVGGLYVSTFSNKKIYIIDSLNAAVSDTIPINIPEPAIGTIIPGTPTTLFILSLQYSGQSLISKKVYKLNLISKQLEAAFNITFSGVNVINGIFYDRFENKLYICNSKSGQSNGELLIYDYNGVLLKTYLDVGGKYPVKIALKY